MKLEKKLIFIVIGVVAFILLLTLVFWLMGSVSKSKVSYDYIEEKMVESTRKYAKDKKGILPSTNEEIFTIDATDLIKKGYMSSFSEYLGEDSNIKCSGEVTIYYTDGVYSYVPLLDCGEDYKTSYLYETLLKNFVSEGDGLYQVIDGKFTEENMAGENMKYIYRGENPRNYIMLDGELWRIVEITADNDIVVIQNEPEIKFTAWDDRYNIEKDKNLGINDYSKSRINEYLKGTYEKLNTNVKSLLTPMDLCIDAQNPDDKSANLSLTCEKQEENQYIGLLSANQFTTASIDEKCIKITDKNCGNYNYLSSIKEIWWLLTADKTDSYSAYYIEDTYISSAYAKTKYKVRPIIKLGRRAIFSAGNGTFENPYMVK